MTAMSAALVRMQDKGGSQIGSTVSMSEEVSMIGTGSAPELFPEQESDRKSVV